MGHFPMAEVDTRYSFTAGFLIGAAIFARHAHTIEAGTPTELSKSEHRAYVVGAVVHSVAAIDTEASEITMHGPGHHLGSNGVDSAARDFLKPLAKLIDDETALDRYETILHLLRKPSLNFGAKDNGHADLLVKLRNELIHYKSKWGREMTAKRLFNRLERLELEKPPFMPMETNFFPHRCLSASLASWAVETSVGFLNGFYQHLGIKSVLDAHAKALVVPPPRKMKS